MSLLQKGQAALVLSLPVFAALLVELLTLRPLARPLVLERQDLQVVASTVMATMMKPVCSFELIALLMPSDAMSILLEESGPRVSQYRPASGPDLGQSMLVV